ncbi:MAG TPA: HAD family phosphatase [Streptosporangiaceae bacterium]
MSGTAHISVVCCGLIGTLISDGATQDSATQDSLVERAFAEAIATQGIVAGTSAYAGSMAQVSRERGRPTGDVFASLFPDNQARAQAAGMAFERSYRAAVDRTGLHILPGADQAIDKLTGSGTKVCLITSLPRSLLPVVLGAVGWRGRTDLALSPDDVSRGYPAPDLVLTALIRLKAGAVSEMAVASGSVSGITAGRRAGARVVAGVLTGPHTPARLRQAGATHLIETIAELPDLLALSGNRPP